ncbi:MAG: membrane protein insertase YidC [Muribaculaceae bacterium]|jgi:YidC/Oxa1 family membrane protein insertase|nr:membrane protein insertase YidC [Muribaculaceae bacterium]
MDKNTIIGMLLMGAVIFGFMWLSQPSKEDLAKQKAQQEQILAEQQKEAAAAKGAVQIDSISAAELSLLKSTIKEHGTSTDGGRTFSLTAGDASLTVAGDKVSGSLKVDNASVSVDKAFDKAPADAALHNRAVAALKTAISNFSKNGDFAKYLSGKDTTVSLQNGLLKVDISSKGGEIVQATLKKYKAFNAPQVIVFNSKTNSYSFVLSTNSQRFDTKNFYFTPVQQSDSTVLMQLDLGGGTKWGLRYTLSKNSYLVKMEVLQEHMEKIIPQNIPTMDFTWTQKMSRHEAGQMFEERNSGIYFKYSGADVENLNEGKDEHKELTDNLKWISFKNQFFSSALIADTHFTGATMDSKVIAKESPEHDAFLKDLSVQSSLDYSSIKPNPASFHFFFGPNLYPLLSSYDKQISPDEDLQLTKLIPLGWKIFRWINTGIIIPIFDFLGRGISSYGLIILLLTIIIKIILSPLTFKSYMSQAKMKILAPDIKEINDKYPGKDNAMTRQQKTMELYSKAGASPFSGCLPMLLQMPILFAMFTFFPSCIELRGEPFLWASDLSAPDAIVSWTGQIPFVTNYFGNHISLFCLLMTVTNIIYTYLNMQSQQSSSSMPGMKWMMYLMPLMFLVFFNNYAAGLSYYYFISLLITIIQTYACRFMVNEDKMRAKMAANAKKPKKKSGFMARLEEAQRQQQKAMREQQKKGGRR